MMISFPFTTEVEIRFADRIQPAAKYDLYNDTLYLEIPG